MQNTASSSGWIIKQISEEKPSMRAISFQSEEGSHWVHQEQKREERMDMYLKENTFLLDSEIDSGEEKQSSSFEWSSTIPAVKTELAPIAAGSLQGQKQKNNKRGELGIETAESQLKQSKMGVVILAEQMRFKENETVKKMEVIPKHKMSLSSENSSSNALRHSSSTNIMATTKGFNLSTNHMIYSDFSAETSSPYNFRATTTMNRLPGKSDFESQFEQGETFYLSQLNGAISTLHSDRSNSEHMYEDKSSHSAVLTVITTMHGSGSSQISDERVLK